MGVGLFLQKPPNSIKIEVGFDQIVISRVALDIKIFFISDDYLSTFYILTNSDLLSFFVFFIFLIIREVISELPSLFNSDNVIFSPFARFFLALSSDFFSKEVGLYILVTLIVRQYHC